MCLHKYSGSTYSSSRHLRIVKTNQRSQIINSLALVDVMMIFHRIEVMLFFTSCPNHENRNLELVKTLQKCTLLKNHSDKNIQTQTFDEAYYVTCILEQNVNNGNFYPFLSEANC